MPYNVAVLRIILFCRVVDNFGDIGVCWRLARQLAAEHGASVTLVVDELRVFQRICDEVDIGAASQIVASVRVLTWDAVQQQPTLALGDVIVEAFACELPLNYVTEMAMQKPAPRWINLEYLSAEDWVDGFHGLDSLHPHFALRKQFFFPGYSNRSGGLLREKNLLQQRNAFQQSTAAHEFLNARGVPTSIAGPPAMVVSIFAYAAAPMTALLRAFAHGSRPVWCLVPEGVATAAIDAFFIEAGEQAEPDRLRSVGQLRLVRVPMSTQDEYDRLLWACDLNFVRGEDSFVRAQWAGKPMVWQIYPQDEDAHLAKLDAFLVRYQVGMVVSLRQATKRLYEAWNGHGDIGLAWKAAWGTDATISNGWREHAFAWAERLAGEPDLATRLLQYVRKVG